MGLRGYQVEAFNAITKGFGEFQKQLAVKPTGCHAPGSPILMADGSLRAVETIRVGEQVMGPDSQPRTVMELHSGSDDMFEIDPVKGDPFAVNAGHILRLRKTPESPLHREPVHTEISLTDYLSTSQNFRHLHKLERFGVEFPETQVAGRPLDPYFLGLLLGDGCLHQKQIMVCTPDHEIIEMLVRFSQMYGVRLRRVDLTNNAADNYYFVGKEPGYDSDPIRSFVRRLGLAVKSGEKFIPDGYKRGSWEIRADLLAGLLDTDGHGSNGGYEYSSKSPTLSEDVVFVARSLGLAAYRSKKIVGCETYYRVNISGDCSWLPLRVERKKVEVRRQIKIPLVTGFTVHPVGRGEYFGFTIDGDHLYLD
ncbi:MAG: Hint domain-containing homing endonuclease, partial [Verrucomicrobiota bacterium]